MLQLGSRNPDVALLKERFRVASEPGAEQVFDRPLADAIKKFQQSMSLRGDGIVGSSTRAALSGHVSDKVTAVIANMEEWRWMPRSLGATHIFVNVPSFSIVLTDNGRAGLRRTRHRRYAKHANADLLEEHDDHRPASRMVSARFHQAHEIAVRPVA